MRTDNLVNSRLRDMSRVQPADRPCEMAPLAHDHKGLYDGFDKILALGRRAVAADDHLLDRIGHICKMDSCRWRADHSRVRAHRPTDVFSPLTMILMGNWAKMDHQLHFYLVAVVPH